MRIQHLSDVVPSTPEGQPIASWRRRLTSWPDAAGYWRCTHQYSGGGQIETHSGGGGARLRQAKSLGAAAAWLPWRGGLCCFSRNLVTSHPLGLNRDIFSLHSLFWKAKRDSLTSSGYLFLYPFVYVYISGSYFLIFLGLWDHLAACLFIPLHIFRSFLRLTTSPCSLFISVYLQLIF
jgi:hypothetical protein